MKREVRFLAEDGHREASMLLDARGHPFASESKDYASRHELLADLLYFHLDCARQSAVRMDALPEWGAAYNAEFQVHKAALSRAREKLFELKDEGFGVPEDLQPLIDAEGL